MRSHGRRWRGYAALLAVAGTSALVSGTAGAADPAQIGQWAPPAKSPLIGIHTTLLRTGKVLVYSYPETSSATETQLWDPATGQFTRLRLTTRRDIFCSGQSVLPDGRVIATGGHHREFGHFIGDEDYEGGIREVHLYDPVTGVWARGPNMRAERWYPTQTTLPDGRVLVTSGYDRYEKLVRLVEVYDPVANRWQAIRSARRPLDLYPRIHVLPDGRLARVAPEDKTLFLDTSRWRWSSGPAMNFGWRGEAPSVQLPDLNKVLVIGGARNRKGTSTAEILDTSQPTPAWRYTASMRYPRMHANAVLLPDGKVLVVGGGRRGEGSKPIYATEIFDPQMERWTTLAPSRTNRMYHATALLLPDGRVLLTGHDENHTYEVFSPPYLFQGSRPAIGSAPTAISYGSKFEIASADASRIARLALIRPGSVTHSFDAEQRYVSLSFSRDGDRLSVDAPAVGTQAPPGYYMLFAIDDRGVPSVATFIQIA